MTYLTLDRTTEEMDLVYKRFSDDTGFNYHKFLNELEPPEQQEQKYVKRMEELKLLNDIKVGLFRNIPYYLE